MNDLVKREDDTPAPTQQGVTMAQIMELAKDPAIDAEKIGHMINLKNSEEDREAKRRFDRAYALACQQMPVITKDGKIEMKGQFIGWFKKYEDLRGVVDPIINPLGLTIVHDSSEIDGGKGGLSVWTTITFVDPVYTWSETRARVPVPPDAGGAKGAAQAVGSAMTYGQRYSLCAAFGIVQKGLDNDGQSAAAKHLAVQSNQKYVDKVAEGLNEAARGTEALDAWWKALTPLQRGPIVSNGDYDKMVERAEEAS